MYDPALGRWHALDPQAEKYFFGSPYVYGLNNPILFIDPDGEAVYSTNEVLGFHKLPTREEQLSYKGSFLGVPIYLSTDNLVSLTAGLVKGMLTTTKEVASAVVGISETLYNATEVISGASTKDLMNFRSCLKDLSNGLTEQANATRDEAKDLASKMENLKDKTTDNYKQMEADYDSKVKQVFELEDQNRAIKHEIGAVDDEIISRELHKKYM
ncbi:hypothetical protein JCM15548_14731 [Geofilum rubicundum JCM 15548]|uniref:Cell well associated RhsD protein n=2 Tax=Geofilum TaxID=1236988 RepID=A0A0E9LRL0_9BACT|nr:hypothetical protein JCM15548_14731 [Geofilum rubicundum JCM 15548]